MYEHRANKFLDAHVRGAIRDAEQGMRPECIAEMNGAGPDDPVCVCRRYRDLTMHIDKSLEKRSRRHGEWARELVDVLVFVRFAIAIRCARPLAREALENA